jgi:hypothetical protein
MPAAKACPDLAVVSFTGLSCEPPAAIPRGRPHVFCLVTDTLHPDERGCARPGIVRRRGNLRRSGLHLHPNDHNSDHMGAAAGMDRAVGALMSRTVLRSPSGRGPIGADWLRPAGGGDQSWASSHRMRRGPRVDNGRPARCSIRPQHRQAIDDHRHPPCPTTRSVPRLRMPQAPTRGTQMALTAKRRSAPRGTVAR